MKKTKQLIVLASFFAITSIARASDSKDAQLQGYVTDAITKKPVSGVVVSVILPGSTSASQVTTNLDGYYKFNQLPTSQVVLQFDKKGYQPFKKSGIVIKEKSPLKVNVEFSPDELEGEDNEFPVLKMFQLN